MSTHIENINNHDGGVINIHHLEHKVPKQLTVKLGKDNIIGREQELKEIDKRLNSSNSLLLINGIGGIGKSTIASYYLHSQKDKLDYYGFFEGLDKFESELISSLGLNIKESENIFLDILTKLRQLKGEKLLVIDDVKNIEENQETIEQILELKNSGYKILLTSREEIEDVEHYYLDVLSQNDAKRLFNSIYKVEDEALLEEILGYLDNHAFFIEKTAHSIKRTITPQMLKEKFENGKFSQISVKRKQNFDKFLNELFTLDRMDDEEILMLKRLSALPSIEIAFVNLEYIFQKKEDSKFEELLDYLCEKGWLSKLDGDYKLHQIIKEYLLSSHTPSFEEIEVIVESLKFLIKNSTNAQVAVNNRNNIIYFESLAILLDRLDIKNEIVGGFFNNFGNIYHHLGPYQKAEPLYLQASKIWERVLGEENHNTVGNYNDLARHYHNMGEYKKAKPFYLKALKIREKILGENHSDTATSYNNLAGLYDSMGKYKKAEDFYLKALQIKEEVLGKDHHDTGTSYNDLALLYNNMGEYKKALPFYLKTLEIYDKVLIEEHPNRATSYDNLATLYNNMGEYKKAKPFYLKALKIREKILGENHSDTATSYNGLATLYDSMGEYKKAKTLYWKALKIKEDVLEENHPDIGTSYNNLGDFYYERGEFEKAYGFMKKAVEIRSIVLPKNHQDLIKSKEELSTIEQELHKKIFTVPSLKIGRNDPCFCKSGKKYKKCCGK